MKELVKKQTSLPKLIKKPELLTLTRSGNFQQNNNNLTKVRLPSRTRYTCHENASPQKNKGKRMKSIQVGQNSRVNEAQKTISGSLHVKNMREKTKTQFVNFHQTQRKFETSEFRIKPLKREQSDLKRFKQIFVEPIKKNLESLQVLQSKTIKNQKKMSQEYDKLLRLKSGKATHNFVDLQTQESQELKNEQVKKHFDYVIQFVDTSFQMKRKDQEFYEEQMRIQPPDYPNNSMGSTTKGNGFSSSIPLTSKITKQEKLHELLIRAKAGMNTDDIEKQAHLSFYLGMAYEQQKNYASALKFYLRFLGFAKSMQDKVGMALGANRVGVNYFYNKNYKKSIVFHNENLRLSDNQNCFAGFYNLGICYRKLQKMEESIQYFQTALHWAQQNGQTQSTCIAYGQIGMTYKHMQLYQKSLQNFQNSLKYCYKLKRTKLQLCNLTNIILIASQNNLYSEQRILELSLLAYDCAKILDDKRMIEIFSLNLGIIKGKQNFAKFENEIVSQMVEDIEEIENIEELNLQ